MRPVTHVFADDTTHCLMDLGRAHQRLSAAPVPCSPASVLLHTCQRVEWYAMAEAAIPPVCELVGRPSTPGNQAAVVRLAQIASGCRSLIPGERFIHRQVRQATAHLRPDHPLYEVARDALVLATCARERFGLAATVDYSDLPELLLGERTSRPGQLLVIGGGMLARAVAAAPPVGYERVVMMTRGPRKLRRRLKGPNVTVVRHPSLDRALDGRPYDTVIATTNLHGDYQQQVQRAVTGPWSGRVLDLCCVPAVEDRPGGYRHLYDADVLRVLADANRVMADRALLARHWITHNVEVSA